jgi:hypothetical protein
MGNDAAGRRTSGPHDSICFFSSDERRIAPRFQDFGANNVRFGSKADIADREANVRFTPKSGHSRALTAVKNWYRPSRRNKIGRLGWALPTRGVSTG